MTVPSMTMPVPNDALGASAHLYFEVNLKRVGLAQIGLVFTGFSCSSAGGEGVGDDRFSIAYDGHRRKKWHNGTSWTYGRSWSAGCTVGCLVDISSGVLSVSFSETRARMTRLVDGRLRVASRIELSGDVN